MDKRSVLLRWKLDDGHFRVLYGDLRYETVTAGHPGRSSCILAITVTY